MNDRKPEWLRVGLMGIVFLYVPRLGGLGLLRGDRAGLAGIRVRQPTGEDRFQLDASERAVLVLVRPGGP